MNSAYGKTMINKSDTKTYFIFNTSEGKEKNQNINSYICNNFNTIKGFVKNNDSQTQVIRNEIDVSFNLAHVGVLILSYSKRIMNEVMGLASDNKIDIYYVVYINSTKNVIFVTCFYKC
jgi:3D (Asp-Asp-Asp) domain-containing protein